MPQKSLFSEAEKIIIDLRSDARQDLLILIVPSHDKQEKPLSDQEMWAQAAMELFADVFGGATAFKTFAGIWKAPDGKKLHDQPILIESYVAREALEDQKNLVELLAFVKRMARATRQEVVALIVNNVFHEIPAS